MDWWLILVVLGVAVLLRFLWVAAFRPGETVSTVPELGRYVPGERESSDAAPDGDDTPSGEPSDDPRATGLEAVDDEQAARDGVATDVGADADDDAAEDSGVWIELDITPLFPSSEGSPHLIDLSDVEDPEVTS